MPHIQLPSGDTVAVTKISHQATKLPAAATPPLHLPTVIVTISQGPHGHGYVVHAGQASAGGMGSGGAAGQPADTVDTALSLARIILQEDAVSPEGPGADDAFQRGFSASTAPTPATGRLRPKY